MRIALGVLAILIWGLASADFVELPQRPVALATPAIRETCRYLNSDGNVIYSNAEPDKSWKKLSCFGNEGAPDSTDATHQLPRGDPEVGRRVQGSAITGTVEMEIGALLRLLMYLGIGALIAWWVVRRLGEKNVDTIATVQCPKCGVAVAMLQKHCPNCGTPSQGAISPDAKGG